MLPEIFITTDIVTRETEMSAQRNRVLASIPKDSLSWKYETGDRLTKEAISEFPSLVYLLGKVAENPLEISEEHPNRIWLLKEGSGMFGLKNPEDAVKWKGIFNHILGTARNTFILADFLSKLTADQIQEFTNRGYDTSNLGKLNPALLRDFMLISHAGRRESDELKEYSHFLEKNDRAHLEVDPGLASLRQLKEAEAPDIFIDLMRVEVHGYLTGQIEQDGMFCNFEDIVLTIPDWMFGQAPNTLEDRFRGLRASKRASEATLDMLELGALNFQNDFEEITERSLNGLMTEEEPPLWEDCVRRAYCSPSGIDPETTFPGFYEQYPQLK